MILAAISRKSIIFSALSHAFLFLILSFSFSNKLMPSHSPGVSFWGALLSSKDLVAEYSVNRVNLKRIFIPQSVIPKVSVKVNLSLPRVGYALKPAVALSGYEQKAFVARQLLVEALVQKKKDAVVMLYPALPYKFNLYFKDRQVAHIELEYKIVFNGKTSAVVLKRKISSGSLEADLLCMRYIYHYLSMQKDRLSTDKWQSVNIELELKK